MKMPGKKGIASVILALIGFVFLMDDLSGRLQKFEMIVPVGARPFLPLLYGGLFLAVLLLIRSEHKDEIEALKQPDVASLHQANTRSENEIAALRDKLAAMQRDAPRHLTDAAKQTIVDRLRPSAEAWRETGRTPQIQVNWMAGNDCAEYAREFEEVLESIDFQIIHAILELSVDSQNDDYRKGITIKQDTRRRSELGIPLFGDILHKALLESGIEATLLERSHFGGTLILIVGARR
jgi:hypothetical protein